MNWAQWFYSLPPGSEETFGYGIVNGVIDGIPYPVFQLLASDNTVREVGSRAGDDVWIYNGHGFELVKLPESAGDFSASIRRAIRLAASSGSRVVTEMMSANEISFRAEIIE